MKPCYITLPKGNKAISKAVQSFLADLGCRWTNGGESYWSGIESYREPRIYVQECGILVNSSAGFSDGPCLPVFDAMTEFGKLVDYLSEPAIPEPPKIMFEGSEVGFTHRGVAMWKGHNLTLLDLKTLKDGFEVLPHDPSCIINVGPDSPAKRAVFATLLSLGYSRPSDLPYRAVLDVCLRIGEKKSIDHCDLGYYADNYPELPRFDAYTEFGKLVDHLSAPSTPKIVIAGHAAEFNKETVKIGCKTVPKALVLEVYERLSSNG